MQSFDIAEFLSRSTDTPFEETTLATVLSNLPDLGVNGPWLAGGSLRRTLLGREITSDFDFFFQDVDQLKDFEKDLKSRGLYEVRRTRHHVHYKGTIDKIERDIQLVHFLYYKNAEEVINSFDFTICQLVFDGDKIIIGDYTLWDIARKRLAINKITFPISTMRRMIKYTSQGFTACAGCMTSILVETSQSPELMNSLDIHYVD